MINIDDILIEKKIINNYFLCDIEKCKGACCTFEGLYGAPLKDEEVPVLKEQVSKCKHLLSSKSKEVIKSDGVAEKKSGRWTSVCINKRDCVFVYYDKQVAKCAIENVYLAGKTNFRKPISCWLFPIRVAKYQGTTYLYYEEISECSTAIQNGKQHNVKLYQSLKEPLIAAFGLDWYNKLLNIAENK